MMQTHQNAGNTSWPPIPDERLSEWWAAWDSKVDEIAEFLGKIGTCPCLCPLILSAALPPRWSGTGDFRRNRRLLYVSELPLPAAPPAVAVAGRLQRALHYRLHAESYKCRKPTTGMGVEDGTHWKYP